MQKNQIAINSFWVFAAFAVNFFVGFFMSSYLVDKLGIICYGFISLTNNLFIIINMFTVALNSMAGRFLAVSIYKNDFREANVQFNTVFWADLLLLIPLVIILGIIFCFRSYIFRIPQDIASMVANLIFMQIIAFMLSLMVNNFGSVFFVKNRLDLQHSLVILNKFFYVGLILILFKMFKPSLTLIGVALLAPLVLESLIKVILFHKFIPEIKISFIYFNLKKLWVLISSGVWNTVTLLARICLFNLDVYLANVFVGPHAAGTMAIAKIIPMQIDGLNAAVVSVFSPILTKIYVENNQESLNRQIMHSMNFNSFTLLVPSLIFITYGDVFFSLWMPHADTSLVHNLACLSIIPLFFSVPAAPLFTIQFTYNKLKVPALVLLSSSFLIVFCEIILLKYSSMGLLALAVPMAVISPLRNLTFTGAYTARIIGLPWNYWTIRLFAVLVKTLFLFVFIRLFRYFFVPKDWMSLIFVFVLCSLLSWIVAFFIYFDAEERNLFGNFIVSIIKKTVRKKL